MPSSDNDGDNDNTLDFSDRVRAIVEADGFHDVCYLIKNQIPFDIAWLMDREERLAYIIKFGQLDGLTWSWSRMEFVPVTGG